jgi:NADPH-dependent curcumin reductase CurA
MSVSTREWQLVRRPHGEPVDDDFALVSLDRPDPQPGEVVVETIAMSVDPYMRGRMNATKSYAASWELGETMQGGAIGRVVDSRSDDVPVGALVLHGLGWRDVAVVPAAHVSVVQPLPGLPLSLYLGVLGMPGLTAWAGLFRLAAFAPGDVVFVSGAAGAVGSLVGQFARLRGASRVVGSAGTAEKVEWLRSIGFDAAFDYHDGPVADSLAAAAPDGIDVFFDNVGGEHLEAAIDSINLHGHMAICGMISQYNATEPNAAPRNLHAIIAKRFTMRGLLAIDYFDRRADFIAEVAPLVARGKLKYAETVVEGIRNAPQAFLDMLGGANTGKMLVRVAD